jgi:hypothetical protein
MMVFFENDHCLKCGRRLGFLPDLLELSALEPAPDGKYRPSISPAAGKNYRACANGKQFQVCNWMVPDADPNPLCFSCRLNQVIPDLADGKNLERWKKLEHAKRRCLYTFLKLGLPAENVPGNGALALWFRFLEDKQNEPVKTGHQDGVITVNVAEADGDEREHRRLALHEPYRTLVGHLRHESGHYYWDRLIANSSNLQPFRDLFGDETADYDTALKNYYQAGPPADWPNRTVTAYASSHPWEDWAETWAHYLHITDTLETARSFGVTVTAGKESNRAPKTVSPAPAGRRTDFDDLLATWTPLTCALNSINRGMGLADLYPFVISPAVIEKLRFIDSVIKGLKRPLPAVGDKPVASKTPPAVAGASL